MAIKNKKVNPDDVEKSVVISFFNNDYLEGFEQDNDNPMVIIAAIHNYVVKRILMD